MIFLAVLKAVTLNQRHETTTEGEATQEEWCGYLLVYKYVFLLGSVLVVTGGSFNAVQW